MALPLKVLQQHLQHIYEVDLDHCVDDFVITDRALANSLASDARDVNEKLLVRQNRDSVDLSLFLDEALVNRLVADDPIISLHDGNLADFCTVLEGVSHFLYLVWNAEKGRSISCLELEMQAEVDKYIALAVLIGRQRSYVPARLHQWLFAEPVFAGDLDENERVRYHDANQYAAKYCFHLQQRYLRLRDNRGGSLLNELRRFYRRGLREKIRWIDLCD